MKIRAEAEGNYTVINNTILQDTSISYKAKGLFIDMLSLPDDWKFTIQGLTKRAADGKASVESAMKELENAGYVVREQKRTQGKFASTEYVIIEIPSTDFPMTEKRTAEKTSTTKPFPENRAAENQALLNTNILNTILPNTNKQNKPPISPRPKQRKLDDVLWEVEDEALREALGEFVKMRKQNKKQLTVHALELNIKKLYGMSTDAAELVKIVEQSVMNSWQGFYPLKNGDEIGKNRNNDDKDNIFLKLGREEGLF